MKILRILLIILAMLSVGFAMADPGMKPVPETQGISTSTSIKGVGNLETSTTLMIIGSSGEPLGDIPPLDSQVSGSTYYVNAYEEKSMNLGSGVVGYTKELDIETGAVGTGLSNVKSTRIITFDGGSTSRLTSEESMFIAGSGMPYAEGDNPSICPFSGSEGGFSNPAFCNQAEAGSYIDMTVANVRTSTDSRFIVSSADSGVELNYDIVVTDLEGAPSTGGAEAYIKVIIREGRNSATYPTGMFEELKYSDSTSIFGDIMFFEKDMSYVSSPTR